MRTTLILLAMLLLSTPALAESNVSVRVDGGRSSWNSDWSWQMYWGDPVLYGDMAYWNDGQSPYWGDRGGSPAFRGDRSFGSHPNDWPGYRLFIPRGLEGPPQYYGAPPGGSPQYGMPHRVAPHRRRGYPVVLHYSYGNPYHPYPTVLYTAPSYPELGYYGPEYGYFGAAAPTSPWDYSQPSQPPAVNNYDYRTYNYYYGQAPQSPPPAAPQAPGAASPPSGQATPPAAPNEAPAVVDRTFGVRFFDQTRLETPQGAFRFKLDEGKLTAGPDVGPQGPVADGVDGNLGVLAEYEPGVGVSLVFRRGDALCAAYPLASGEWWIEQLPYSIDFTEKVTLGLVGGGAWVVFTGSDSARYVVSFSGHSWREVGKGTRPPS